MLKGSPLKLENLYRHMDRFISLQSLLDQALKFFQQRAWEEADRVCDQVLKEDPKQGEALNLKGMIALQQGAYEIAIDWVKQAILVHEQKAPHYLHNLALIYTVMGRILSAAKVYQRAAEIFAQRMEKNDELQTLQKGAYLLRDHGELEEAKYWYLRLLERDTKQAWIHNDLGLILRSEKELESAEHFFLRALELTPDDISVLNNLGLVHLEQKRYKEAISLFEKTLALDPDCVEAYVNLSNLYREEEQFVRAEASGKRALELSPDHPGILNNLGLICHLQGRLEEAIAYYRQALKILPSYAPAKNHLSQALVALSESARS